ncbi:uncharacterized protein LOC110016570 [Oryzias latipes]|uniref:uncharacterized protein LOC110016570 n=1 Tax=Oryzias latipes TaxID=8090 RepID=UPI0009DA786B|nr:uncharacterized protein LOC110016570 [Oryzias latipes]
MYYFRQKTSSSSPSVSVAGTVISSGQLHSSLRGISVDEGWRECEEERLASFSPGRWRKAGGKLCSADFATKQKRNYQTPVIDKSPVERVNSFRYLGFHITQDLSWSCHINTVVKKARQRLYHLRRLRDFRLPSVVLRNFYSCTIESILTGNITTWFGNSTMRDRRALQRVVRSAERIIHTELPDLHSIYSRRCWTRARKITKDLSHPDNGLFSLLRSGKRFRSLKANTERLRRSFFPQAIRSLNQ